METITLKKMVSVLLATAMLSACSLSGNGKKDEVKNYFNPQPVDTGYTWSNVEIGGGGFIPAIIYNPTEEGLSYARTDMGGAYRKDKRSPRWEPITDFLGPDNWNLSGIESIATDPVEPNRVYMACGTYLNYTGVILRSDDYGENWEVSEQEFACGANEPGRGAGERLMVDPNDNSIIYFATRTQGLWKSSDYGKTFDKVNSFPVTGNKTDEEKQIGLTWVEFDKSSEKSGKATKTIFVGAAETSGKTVYMSTDGGKTWSDIPNQPESKLFPIHGRVSNDGYLYITYANSVGPNGATSGAVRKYNIATSEWTDITPKIKGSCGFSGLSIDNLNQQTIVVSTLNLWSPEDNIFRSTDGGLTWNSLWDVETQEKNYEMDISDAKWLNWHGKEKLGWWMACVAIDPFNSNIVTYGTGATVFSTTNITKLGTDEKVVVKVDVQGIEENAVFDIVSPPSGPQLYSIMGDTYGYRHDDVTVAPTQHYNIMTSRSIDFSMANPNFVVRTGNNEEMPMMYSMNGGDTWEFIESVPKGFSTDTDAGTVCLSADGTTILWQSSKVGTVAHISTDLGKSWTKTIGLPSGAYITSDRVNPDYFYGVYDGSFYVSSDKGKHFEKQPYMVPTGKNVQIEAVPNVAGDVWVSSGSVGLMYISNFGKTPAIRLDNVKISNAIGFGKSDKDDGYMAIYMLGEAVGGEGYGVYRSTDKGETWKRINDDAHQFANVTNSITGDYNEFGTVYFCTNGRGIVMGKTAE